MSQALIKEPLSNHDLHDFISEMGSINRKTCNYKMGSQIRKMRSVGELFGNNRYCILFIENKYSSIGHWVITFHNNGKVYFCDSYGSSPKKLCPELIPLLLSHYDDIFFNKVQYQEYGDKSATCGRFCILIIGLMNIIKNFDLDKFYEFMEEQRKKRRLKNYNQVVAKFVNIDL